MYPPFLTSMLTSKGLCSYIWKGSLKDHSSALNRASYHLSSLSLYGSHPGIFDPYHRGAYQTPRLSLRALVSTDPPHLTPPQRRHISQSGHFVFYLDRGRNGMITVAVVMGKGMKQEVDTSWNHTHLYAPSLNHHCYLNCSCSHLLGGICNGCRLNFPTPSCYGLCGQWCLWLCHQ